VVGQGVRRVKQMQAAKFLHIDSSMNRALGIIFRLRLALHVLERQGFQSLMHDLFSSMKYRYFCEKLIFVLQTQVVCAIPNRT
jgi:hypothetical protein